MIPAAPLVHACTLLVFDESNRLLCGRHGHELGCTLQASGDSREAARAALQDAWLPAKCSRVAVAELRQDALESGPLAEPCLNTVLFAVVDDPGFQPPSGFVVVSLLELSRLSREQPDALSPCLRRLLPLIRQESIRIPYLNFKDTEYIYRFRTDRERNRAVYRADSRGLALYQSRLCEAIKAQKRRKERTADQPAILDFGAVRYRIPSHFGFCLGVQNAIERAYETIAENPGRRVFMLSELIHNPFVNDDLIERGLQYLQNDKGRHLLNPATGKAWWDELTSDDIVIIPAFGATDADKRRLIERGIPLNRFDATCMLVEKVWKAARRHGQDGYTVIIHGKAEHEETKATFSNSSKYAPSLIVRDLTEMQHLGQVIEETDPARRWKHFEEVFAGRASAGFDPLLHLERIAVVNQTTLLRNETLALIDHLEQVFLRRHGPDRLAHHLSPASRGDTLCYATQVNQDALQQALSAGDVDFALVIGGKNSSNTYQLYRICKERFGERAGYIQSERNLQDPYRLQHYIFQTNPGDPRQGRMDTLRFLPDDYLDRTPPTLLLTGGASCPDGVIQQVVTRINSFFPEHTLRPVEEVLSSLT